MLRLLMMVQPPSVQMYIPSWPFAEILQLMKLWSDGSDTASTTTSRLFETILVVERPVNCSNSMGAHATTTNGVLKATA